MERDEEKVIDIPGEITSVAVGHVVTAARDIFDYGQSEYLSVINAKVNDTLELLTVGIPTGSHIITLEDIDAICN